MREFIANQRSHLMNPVPEWETESEVLVPLVFKMDVNELRRVRRLSVDPITGAPAVEPGLGESLMKFLKSLAH
jgi:hypothetical protein